VLQRSAGRTVEVEEGGGVVRKTFAGSDPERSRLQAEAEFHRLQRFSEALADVPGAACPRPLEILAGEDPVLRMERVAGRPLLELLRATHLSPELRERIAEAAATGLARYVDALGEPYEDFQFDNMLFDAPSSTLALLDLGAPDGSSGDRCAGTPLALSLGNLVGSTMFQSARPKWLLRPLQHRQAVALCGAVVTRVAAGPAEVLIADLVPIGRAAYKRSAFGGGWARRLWYQTVGFIVARRPEILGVTFTPPRRPDKGSPTGHPRGSDPRSVPGRTNRK
jgi:hypothetical protein